LRLPASILNPRIRKLGIKKDKLYTKLAHEAIVHIYRRHMLARATI
jgi:hypothetical protein